MSFTDSPKTKNDLLKGSYKRKSRAIQKNIDKRNTWIFASYKFRKVHRKTTLSQAGVSFLSDCNWNRTHNNLVRKRALNHLAKLAKGLSCVVSTCLYVASDCMFLSCHVHVSKWIQSECQGTPCSKQTQNFVPASSKELLIFRQL